MKKLILLSIWLVFLAWSYSPAQDVNTTVEWQSFFKDTLTNTIDTIDVKFLSPERFNCYTIMAISDGADTLDIYTKTFDDSTWVKHGAVDLSDNTDETQLYISTTAKEWLILDPEPRWGIRIISNSNDGSYTKIIVMGKKQE